MLFCTDKNKDEITRTFSFSSHNQYIKNNIHTYIFLTVEFITVGTVA